MRRVVHARGMLAQGAEAIVFAVDVDTEVGHEGKCFGCCMGGGCCMGMGCCMNGTCRPWLLHEACIVSPSGCRVAWTQECCLHEVMVDVDTELGQEVECLGCCMGCGCCLPTLLTRVPCCMLWALHFLGYEVVGSLRMAWLEGMGCGVTLRASLMPYCCASTRELSQGGGGYRGCGAEVECNCDAA